MSTTVTLRVVKTLSYVPDRHAIVRESGGLIDCIDAEFDYPSAAIYEIAVEGTPPAGMELPTGRVDPGFPWLHRAVRATHTFDGDGALIAARDGQRLGCTGYGRSPGDYGVFVAADGGVWTLTDYAGYDSVRSKYLTFGRIDLGTYRPWARSPAAE